jgi:hypothetical protein
MTRDLADDLAYLEGQISVALRHDAGRKLKCKEGYVQRGNACQKVTKKASGGNLARSIGTGLGVAALAGGAAAGVAIASRRGSQSGNSPVSKPDTLPAKIETVSSALLPKRRELIAYKASKVLSDKRVRKAAIAAGSTGAVIATVVGIGSVKLTKDYAVKDIALIMTYKQSLILGKAADRILDKSDINPDLKGKAKDLIGMTKLALARKTMSVKGRDLIDVDKESNSFTYRDRKNGGIYTVASVGPALYTFTSVFKKEVSAGKVYEVSFAINESNNREESANLGASGAKQIIRLTRQSFDKHVEAVPDNVILTAGAYDKDGAGKKRKNIYENVGFAPMEGQDPMVLYAAKKDGKLQPLSSVYSVKKPPEAKT